MSIIYIITTVLSLLLTIGYFLLIKKRNLWMCLLFIFIFIVNLGYMMLSKSKSLEFAIFSNVFSYFGSVYLPIYMIIIVIDICGIKRNKLISIILPIIATLVFGIVLTQTWSNYYYASVSLEITNGYSKLIKEYGPLHVVYTIYLITSFISMIIIIVYSMIANIKDLNKEAIFIVFIVFGNIGVWAIEQFIKVDFEFLAASYLISECALFFMYWIGEDYLEQKIIAKQINEEDYFFKYEKFMIAISESNNLTNRELEVLRAILQNKKRKDIAGLFNVSENTIKTHTSHIFEKIGVENRRQLFEKAEKY